MNYQEVLNYLYESVPMFQKVGGKAYKEGLENTHVLDKYFDFPHKQYRTIHVGGTNGKGSCSHTIAAVLQSAGYRVGLYTSPHLVDFRERIRVNGEEISQRYVVDFVDNNRDLFESLSLSFFELTTAMAFRYFADMNVDVAVIEVGLGGRLDCTNIITPDLSVITNIGLDHTQFLGSSLDMIASEKAGIIKPHVPVVIGETVSETKNVFLLKAIEVEAPITFAEDSPKIISHHQQTGWLYQTTTLKDLNSELGGLCQLKNANTILNAIDILKSMGYNIDEQAIRNGFQHVCKLTGLKGRWQKLSESPAMICDTGHNVDGIKYIVQQLSTLGYDKLHFVIGMVNDKDVSGVLDLLPKSATYYFTKASINRALDENELMRLAFSKGLSGHSYSSVKEAVCAAKGNCGTNELIFIGGSTFIVADLLASCAD